MVVQCNGIPRQNAYHVTVLVDSLNVVNCVQIHIGVFEHVSHGRACITP